MIIIVPRMRAWKLGELTLFRHGFDDALRSHGGNDSRELIIGGIEVVKGIEASFFHISSQSPAK
jgi:hypothetical protein